MATVELRGTIERVLSIGQAGGTIFALKLAGRGRSARVVADFDVALTIPFLGETWEIEG
ncbi:hypothetical protein OR214_02689, partial [Ralstonia pickettii OR214]